MSDVNKSRAGNTFDVPQAAVMRAGVILPKKHPTDPSLYYVNFGEKTASQSGRLETGMWCNNGVSGFVRYRDSENNPVSYGSHMPLQPYSPVYVMMSNGGLGSNTIIGFQPTNTRTPDINNVDGLHIVRQTPNGSSIEMDDKLGAIRLMYDKGATSLSLSDDLLAMEVMTGNNSGSEAHTGLFIKKGSFKFRLKDSTMQFDETGLSVSFDDGGTSLKLTKKGFTVEDCELFKVASNEQVSLKGQKTTIEGVKDASFTGNEVKLGGKQLTSLNGTQINIEAIHAISLKSLGINFFATAKLQEFLGTRDSITIGSNVRTAALFADKSSSHNIVTGVYARHANLNLLDKNFFTNMGLGTSTAVPAYASNHAALMALHTTLTTTGTLLLTKQAGVVAANKILADTIAGTSEPAMEPVGNVSGARDKNDKKSFNSVAATSFAKNRSVMEKYSTTSNLLTASMTGVSGTSAYVNSIQNIKEFGTSKLSNLSRTSASKNKIVQKIHKMKGK